MRHQLASIRHCSVCFRSIKARMQCSTRVLIVAAFLVLYLVFTIFLARVEHSCPTLEQLVLLDENRPFADALKRMVRAANGSEPGEQVGQPLARLGVDVPLAEPPTNGSRRARARDRPPAAPEPTEHAYDRLPVEDLLRAEYAPNNVFLIWCGRRWFEFRHYLSVRSAIRELHPDNVIFFYDELPVTDAWMYNTWFDELRDEYPFFRLWPLNDADRKEACVGNGSGTAVSRKFVDGLLTYRGGIYLHETTVLSRLPLDFRNRSLVDGIDPATGSGFMLTQRGLPGRNVPVDDILRAPEYRTQSVRCGTVADYVRAYRKPVCVTVDEPIFPKDIWRLDDAFGRLARRVFYGDPDIRPERRSDDELIPNIAHVVWIGGGQMDFLFYLCVLSLLYVADVRRVYLHGDAPPTGPYWDRIRTNERLTIVYRDTPATVYGNKVDVISHVTDVWRVDFMVKYGGIYVDTDVVFVRPLDRDIRSYDAVGSYDWTYWNPPFPDTINFGVAIGKRNAPFWRQFQKSMKWFVDKDWSWNGLRQPYRIKERHPELVRIDPRLQVICFEAKCHPTWWPNYHDENVHHLNTNSIKNWLNDTYAFHWTLPTPKELLSEENLLNSTSMFAEIGKYVLKKAGLLPAAGGS